MTNSPTKVSAAHERVGANILANWAGYGVNMIVGFLVAPLLVHRLGDAGYGIWSVGLQLGAYLSVLDFGIRAAVGRYVTHHHARDEREQMDAVMSVALAALSLVAVLCILATLVIVHYLPSIIKLPPGMLADARWTVLLIGLQIAVAFPGALFNGALAAVSRYDLMNLRRGVTVVVRGLLFWIVLASGHGLVAVAAMNLLAMFGGFVWDFWLAWRVYGGFEFRLRREQLRACLRPLFEFSAFAFLLGISSRLLLWSDNIVIGAILGAVAVTFYAIGLNLVDLMLTVLNSVTCVFVPLATSYDAQGDRRALRDLLLRGSRLSYLLILPGVVGFIALGAPFISLWMGPRFAGPSSGVLTLLSITLLFAPMRMTCNQILYGMNRHKYYAYLALGEALANLGLSILLAYKMGLLGVAWGTLIPALVVEAFALPYYTARQLDVKWTDYYWQSWLRPSLAAIPYAGWLVVARALGLTYTWLGFFSSIAGGLILFGVSVWFLGLSGSEKAMLVEYVHNTWRRVSCTFGD